MATTGSVERQFKLMQRILTDGRAAMNRFTEMLLHLILSNQICFERFKNFEFFSRSINMGVVGSRNYADTLFAIDTVLRDIYSVEGIFKAFLPTPPSLSISTFFLRLFTAVHFLYISSNFCFEKKKIKMK